MDAHVFTKTELMEMRPSIIKKLINENKINTGIYKSTMGLIVLYLKYNKIDFELSKEELEFMNKEEIIDMYMNKKATNKIKLNLKELSNEQLEKIDVTMLNVTGVDFNELSVSQLRSLAKEKIEIKGLKVKSEIVNAINKYFISQN